MKFDMKYIPIKYKTKNSLSIRSLGLYNTIITSHRDSLYRIAANFAMIHVGVLIGQSFSLYQSEALCMIRRQQFYIIYFTTK